jgi:KaiC/GvpD/RAD55 family RecA-like ATPase
MLSLQKNKKINLDIPSFLCDSGINPKLNDYPMLKHLNSFCFNIIIGKPGSGKTSLIISFIQNKCILKKQFNNVLIVMPEPSRKSLKKNIFEKHNQEKMYDELTRTTINDIYNKLNEYTNDNETTLLILDDVGASLKNKDIANKLREIIYNRRHLKCQIITLAQSYISLPKEIRKMVNNIFIMYKPNKPEIEILFDEIIEQKKDLALDIIKLSLKKPHDYLMINIDNQKFYSNFDEIIISDDEI